MAETVGQNAGNFVGFWNMLIQVMVDVRKPLVSSRSVNNKSVEVVIFNIK